MNDDTLIKVDGVSKKFCRTLKRSMIYGFNDIAKDTFNIKSNFEQLRQDEFWAVKDVSFEVNRGECVGIIGRNGAGKSTLLKMLNGIFLPDSGQISIKGKVGALIEVGAGFHPLLSGRENIYINGAILGMNKKEIDKKFDDIVAFAELEKFIDMPVKSYSSGMYVRLGFSIAIHMQPDVLILDEILAVGDLSFQAKSFNSILNLAKNSAIIFVSHNMNQISRLCSKAVVLHQGKCISDATNVAEAIEIYNNSNELFCESSVSGSKQAEVHSLRMYVDSQLSEQQIEYGQNWRFEVDLAIDSSVTRPGLSLSFVSQDLKLVAECVSHFNQFNFINDGKRAKVILDLGQCNLNPGAYWIRVAVQGNNFGQILIRYENYMKIVVKGHFISAAPVVLKGNWNKID